MSENEDTSVGSETFTSLESISTTGTDNLEETASSSITISQALLHTEVPVFHSSEFDLSHDIVEEQISYQTISSTDSSTVERPERLHEWLKLEDIQMIYETFLESEDQKLSHTVLRRILESLDIEFTDFEYCRLFLKINQNRDFKCDWNEFVSYLIFGFQEDDPSTQKEALIMPISTPPIVKKSEHRSPICCITLMKPSPEMEWDESVPAAQGNIAIEDAGDALGMWITGSREGHIRFWSPILEPLRSGYSHSYHLDVPTWILAMQALSDVGIVCISSTERELRFHETMAATFNLRIVMRSLPRAINCLGYNFHSKGEVFSRLCMGDLMGTVYILEFSPVLRGPFQSKPGSALIDVLWSDVVKGTLSQFFVREFIDLHSEPLSKLFYSIRLSTLFTSAEYRNQKRYRGRCPGLISITGAEPSQYRVPLGVKTFCVDEAVGFVVTAGADSYIRIWDVYLTNKPIGILTGHNSGVVFLFLQPEEDKIYSVDYHKVLKVWHMYEHTCLQTFNEIAHLFPAEMELAYHYHSVSRDLLVGGRKVVSIKCSPRIRVDLTDGNTHAAPVTVVLYNKLFRNLVTCGLDSYIIVWDPFTGRRKIILKSCHTKVVYGEVIDIEITSACFDPLEQFLLTGARDGSLKIWNYNNAVCIRNMNIKAEHEVTAVIWVVERILAVGWDKQVTEFNDIEGREFGDPKKWPMFHTDDITCADVKIGEGVVTATYSGEVIFWKLETGQPYRRYNVEEPRKFIELQFNNPIPTEVSTKPKIESQNINVSRYVRKSISANIKNLERKLRPNKDNTHHKPLMIDEEDSDEERQLEKARAQHQYLPVSVQVALFLQTRPMTPQHGTVLIALDNGHIQIYSHHQRGGYINEFLAVHKTGDCVLAMCTDRKDKYLFTGTAFGYVKIWLIWNFGASHDCSVRLWSMGGRYLGTLGTPLPWKRLSPFEPVDEEQPYRIPPDIKKIASSTTIKVISGVQSEQIKMQGDDDKKEEENILKEEEFRVFGKPLSDPVLGQYFHLPGKVSLETRIELDKKLPYMPVYSHLRTFPAKKIPDTPIPPIIGAIANESFMGFYKPVPPKPKPIQKSSRFFSGLTAKVRRYTLHKMGR